MSNRRIIITGNVNVVDDEWPANSTRCNYRIHGEAIVGESQPSSLITWQDCCGGEVRVELELDAIAMSNGDARLTGNAKLFEGTGCDTEDLEDSKNIDFLIPGNNMTTSSVNLKSTGVGGGDKADISLSIANFPA